MDHFLYNLNAPENTAQENALALQYKVEELQGMTPDQLKMMIATAIVELEDKTSKEHAFSFCSACLVGSEVR